MKRLPFLLSLFMIGCTGSALVASESSTGSPNTRTPPLSIKGRLSFFSSSGGFSSFPIDFSTAITSCQTSGIHVSPSTIEPFPSLPDPAFGHEIVTESNSDVLVSSMTEEGNLDSARTQSPRDIEETFNQPDHAMGNNFSTGLGQEARLGVGCVSVGTIAFSIFLICYTMYGYMAKPLMQISNSTGNSTGM